MNPTLKALMDTTDVLIDAIKCIRALEYDGVADILTKRMLDACLLYTSDAADE